ncbi:hypothetical protein SRHO_G00286010 [Serrasalmus rhombeus]
MTQTKGSMKMAGDSHRPSELRIVLLGYRYAGKSSAGNTILNREEFELKRTAQCVKRQGEAAGRHITVVEAPGWWRMKPVERSTELMKQEIVLSVSLCPPGPHAVLLIINVDDDFKETYRNIVGHLKLLTDSVWNHTLVLFTCGDCLGDTPIEKYIESEGKELQWLVEKCGNRYHVLNNKNRSDDTQVTELLEKIEEMVAANSGHHFELDRKVLQEVEEKRRAEEERAKERMMKVQKQREHIMSQMSDAQRLSELRIVLLGYRYAGKSSAGNTILNREEFELKRTAQCVKRQGEAAGRHITVVEAPGWWTDTPVKESTELLKQEIVLSVSLCPPGPHAVLLIINVDDDFKETYRNIVGHLKLLTDSVWNHTLVLFTCGDCLGDTPIEKYIESEGKELQWLVEKCGNRYHVLNNKNRSDDTQVTELLEKIEEMVAANSGHHFELDRKVLQEVEEKRRAEEERAKERMMKVQKQREHIMSQMSDAQRLSELRIVLLGYRYTGKSSAGNTILNREEFELRRTAQCVKRQGEAAGRHITVVEAPGWWTDTPVKESTELLKQEIVLSVSLCPPGPHAVLLIINVDDDFKETYRNIVGHLKLLTDSVWNHTLVLFTCGDCLGDTPIEKYIESEGKELQWLVEKCGNRYHVLNNKNRSDDTQVTELLEKIEEMVAANSGHHFELDRKVLQEVEEKRRAEEERAKERMMKVQKQREHIMSQMSDAQRLSELRIVLLGYRYAGKSSAGNTILNREEFELKRTAQCVKRQGEAAGRHITVVEAPGWWMMKPVEESTELLKQEIVLSVSLCPPGPHAVLLIINVDDDFKKTYRNIVGHLKLLTDSVWNHTLVLFTCGDCLGDTPIEKYIESEGKELQWLVEKCGNRYHVLNNKNRSDDTQVTELLEKIEEMVAENSKQSTQRATGTLERTVQPHSKKKLLRLDTEPQTIPYSEAIRKMFIGGSNLSTGLRRFGLESRPSSSSSYLSMKTEYSEGPSPVPSEVSMKTDWSMHEPRNFSGSLLRDNQRFGLESRPSSSSSYLSMKTEYSEGPSPVPSEVSMKTDWSMHEPRNFSGSLSRDNQRFGLESRPSSSSSYLSMKTEYSEGPSPVPSEVSMKTDWSMHEPRNFSGSLSRDNQRFGLESRPSSSSS